MIRSAAECSGEMQQMAGQAGFLDLDERHAALSAAGDPLEWLAAAVDFELFRGELDAARTGPEAVGGRTMRC